MSDNDTACSDTSTSANKGASERAWHSRAAGVLSSWGEGYSPTSEPAARVWEAHRDQVEPWVSAAPAAGVTEARRVASAVLELLAWAMPLLEDLDACMTEEVLQQFIRDNPNHLGSGAMGNVRGRVRRVLKARAAQPVDNNAPVDQVAPARRDDAGLVYDDADWEILTGAALDHPVLGQLLSTPDQQATPEGWADCRTLVAELGIDLRQQRLRRSVQLRALTTSRRPLGQVLAELALGRTAATELAALMPAVTSDDYRALLREDGAAAYPAPEHRPEAASHHTGRQTGHCTGREASHRPEQPSVFAEPRTQSPQTSGGATDMSASATTKNPVLGEPGAAGDPAATGSGCTDAAPAARRRRKPSARQARQAAAAVRAEVAQRVASFPDGMRSYIREQYQPKPPVDEHWHLVKDAVERTLEASAVRGEDSMRKHVTHLAYFFAWAHSVDLPLGAESLTRPHVGRYDGETLASVGRSTRQTRRSRLLQMADQIHPEQAPVKGPALEHRAVAAPYRLAEMAVIRRVAMVQPTPELTRQMCLLVGLGAGAGIDSADLKRLYRTDIVDHGPETGIEVHVTNLRRSKDNTRQERRRTVWVLRQYEDLVRVGLRGLRPNQLLLGKDAERANVAASVYARAALHGDVPELAQSRLRSTWLATHLQRTTPLNVLLRAAGLTTARTLVELIEHLPQSDDAKALR
ncbi:hypothetical protein [Nocardioides pakistanensis]